MTWQRQEKTFYGTALVERRRVTIAILASVTLLCRLFRPRVGANLTGAVWQQRFCVLSDIGGLIQSGGFLKHDGFLNEFR